MKKIVSIINMKGGCGKTTTSVNLAEGFAKKGNKVLLVDFDPQANSSDYFCLKEEPTYIDQMLLDESCTNVYLTQFDNVWLIPSRLELATTERKILLSNKAQHNRLYKVLKKWMEKFDYVIIDCPPTLNTLTVNALNVSDEVIIPIKIDKAAEKGFQITLENIKEISESYDLDIHYKVLFTMVTRTKIDKQKIEDINSMCSEDNVIHTTIRNQAKPIKEASYNQNIVIGSKSGVGIDYFALVDELEATWT